MDEFVVISEVNEPEDEMLRVARRSKFLFFGSATSRTGVTSVVSTGCEIKPEDDSSTVPESEETMDVRVTEWIISWTRSVSKENIRE